MIDPTPERSQIKITTPTVNIELDIFPDTSSTTDWHIPNKTELTQS